jgi:hypothetical protein
VRTLQSSYVSIYYFIHFFLMRFRAKIVENLAAVNYDTNNLYLVLYVVQIVQYLSLKHTKIRLAPLERDGYFSRLKTTIEGSSTARREKLSLPRTRWMLPCVCIVFERICSTCMSGLASTTQPANTWSAPSGLRCVNQPVITASPTLATEPHRGIHLDCWHASSALRRFPVSAC